MNIQTLGLQLVTKQTKEEKKELNRTAVQHIVLNQQVGLHKCTQPTNGLPCIAPCHHQVKEFSTSTIPKNSLRPNLNIAGLEEVL